MSSIAPALIALVGTVVGACATVGAQLIMSYRAQRAERARLDTERRHEREDQRRERRVAQATELHNASVSLAAQLRVTADLYDGLWTAMRSYGTPASKEFFMERSRDAWIECQRSHAQIEQLDYQDVVTAFAEASDAVWHYGAELERWYFTKDAPADDAVAALGDAIRPAIGAAAETARNRRRQLDPDRQSNAPG